MEDAARHEAVDREPPLRLVRAEGRSDSPAWGRFEILKRLIDSRTFAALTSRQRMVMTAMLRYANLHDLIASPSLATLADAAGLNQRSAQKARAELVALGLLQQVDAGGGRRAGKYRLVRSGWESLGQTNQKSEIRGRRSGRGTRNPPAADGNRSSRSRRAGRRTCGSPRLRRRARR